MPARNIQRIRQRRHPFPEHPLLSGDLGAKLASGEYERLRSEVLKHAQALNRLGVPVGIRAKGNITPAKMALLGREAISSYQRLKQLERGHKGDLERLAVSVVAQAHDVDEAQIRGLLRKGKAELRDDLGFVGDGEGHERADEHFLRALQPEIDKRRTHNAIIHGIGIDNMNRAMVHARRPLEAINPRLFHEAGFFSNLASLGHFLFEVPEAMPPGMMPRAGRSRISWEEEGAGRERRVRLSAAGSCFPALVQELSKGVTEITMAHGLPQKGKMSADDARRLLAHTDREIHEPWHFIMGPELYRRMTQAFTKHKAWIEPDGGGNSMVYTRTLLSLLPEHELHKGLRGILSDSEGEQQRGATYLRSRMKEAEKRFTGGGE